MKTVRPVLSRRDVPRCTHCETMLTTEKRQGSRGFVQIASMFYRDINLSVVIAINRVLTLKYIEHDVRTTLFQIEFEMVPSGVDKSI